MSQQTHYLHFPPNKKALPDLLPSAQNHQGWLPSDFRSQPLDCSRRKQRKKSSCNTSLSLPGNHPSTSSETSSSDPRPLLLSHRLSDEDFWGEFRSSPSPELLEIRPREDSPPSPNTPTMAERPSSRMNNQASSASQTPTPTSPVKSASPQQSSTSSRPQKRRRVTPRPPQPSRTVEEIVELSSDDDQPDAVLASAVRKQGEEAIAAQAGPSERKSKLNTLQCTICMDEPTDLTATACGHMFCRDCLMSWLMNREKEPGRKGNCPTCRKALKRTEKDHQVITLELKKK